MANSQSLKQGQQQKAKQRLTPQQLLLGKMIEMPIVQLKEFVQQEVIANPALESTHDDHGEWEEQAPAEIPQQEEEHTADDRYDDDHVPLPSNYQQNNDFTYSDKQSFYDKLKEQMGEHELSEQQRQIMDYLIGSLDNDGLLRKDIDTICDELAIYQGLDTTTQEVADTLHILQQFDPAGVGAQNLQQCLLLQIERRKTGWAKAITKQIVTHYFDDLLKNHWPKLQQLFNLDDDDKETIQAEIRKLNPKPGSSLDEVQGFNIHQITPDFIVDTDDDGTVSFTLNQDGLPSISVAESYTETVNHAKNLSRRDREALPMMRKDLESAKGLIDAIQQRQNTLKATMKAIIRRQYKFFQDGDEADLRPMILKDIADDTGLDISTISRVTNEKYAQTRWGIHRLRFFFSDKYEKDGEEMSTRKIKLALREIIDHEDKSHPFTDAQLEKEMEKKGYPIARRTIVKYREQMKIPKSTLRRE